MEEAKKHESSCCGGGHHKTNCCACLDKPGIRLLILFSAALIVFLLGVFAGSTATDRLEKDRFLGQRFSDNETPCPMRQNQINSSTERNIGCPMR